jgi:catechol 2,3-dioxygenase-like lactoylglutathione lyase family enzyme
MDIQSVHHVAYRCNDAQQTVDFYSKVVGIPYALAVAEDRVPSTGEKTPYMHLFFQLGDGNFIAFFELPESPPMGKDPNTPAWVQHIAFKVADEATLMRKKKEIEARGIDVIGPIDHTICKSIYFHDPNGHRLELAVDTTTPDMVKKLVDVAAPMLADWNKTKKIPKHAAWVHEKAFRRV